MFIHYIHYDANWYYWEDCYSDNKGFLTSKAIWFAGDISKRQARILIEELFPDREIIKNILFHSSPRGHMKNGSRPKKEKYNYKKEREFKDKNKGL